MKFIGLSGKLGSGKNYIAEKIIAPYFQDKYKITDFFAWIFSADGEKLVKSLERNNLIKIDYISRI
jgi:dephospho-CoA kinase